MRVFGCADYVILPEKLRHKFTDRGVFLGYSEDSSGYILYNTVENTFLVVESLIINMVGRQPRYQLSETINYAK